MIRALQALLDQLIQERVASMDALAAQKAALLAAAHRAKSRVVDLRDILITGIALACKALLAARKVRHLEDTIISLINPFSSLPPPPRTALERHIGPRGLRYAALTTSLNPWRCRRHDPGNASHSPGRHASGPAP